MTCTPTSMLPGPGVSSAIVCQQTMKIIFAFLHANYYYEGKTIQIGGKSVTLHLW